MVAARQRIRIAEQAVTVGMRQGKGRSSPHQVQVLPRVVIPCLDAVDVRRAKVLLRPLECGRDPHPVGGSFAPGAFHEVAVDIRRRLWSRTVVSICNDQIFIPDCLPNSLYQRKTIIVISPPVQHDTIDNSRLNRRPGTFCDVLAELRIGKIHTDVSSFFPPFDQVALLVAFPPAVPFGQKARMSIAVSDLGNQDDIRIQFEQLAADLPACFDAFGRESFRKPLRPGIPVQAETSRPVPDKIVHGHHGQPVFVRQIVRRTPGLEYRRKISCRNTFGNG